jgi:glycosyltransferase involved in cell wall biosynthesis
MRCLALTKYGRLAPSSRLRFCQYLPYLESQRITVRLAPLLGDSYVQNLYQGRPPQWGEVLRAYFLRLLHLCRFQQYDLLWIEYELFPWLPAWFESYWWNSKVPCVVECDDAVFHRYDLRPNRLVKALLGSKIDRLMQKARTVIAGNDYLAEHARHAGAREIKLLPTVVDLNRYQPKSASLDSAFKIGWIGNPGTAKYLSLIHEALRQAAAQIPIELVAVGSGPLNLEGVPVQARPWSEAEEAKEIRRFDVGIMPLPDEPWAKGKCGYKLIQYMACALPVIASPVGANLKLVDATNGFLASSTEDWVEAFKTLYHNRQQGIELGQAGRRKVEAEYCLQVTAPRLCRILRAAGGFGPQSI